MKISSEAEGYADTEFFNVSRIIYEEAEQALKTHKFVSHEENSQTDYNLRVSAAAKMAEARMQSYADAYEAEGELIEHDDVIEFIERAKKVIDKQSRLIPTTSGGTITMVRNQWSPEYLDTMLEYFREKAFILMEPKMNELILKSKEAPLKKARRKKMSKRNDLFRWIFEQCHGRQHNSAYLRNFLETHPDWTEKELESASDYFAGEELIEQMDDSGFLVWLTHKGVKAGESLSDVDSIGLPQPVIHQTQHNNTFNAPVGAVQQGNQNIANTSILVGANISEIRDLLQQLRNHMTPEDEQDGSECIDAIVEELDKEAPRESRIRSFLKTAGNYANETGKSIVAEIVAKLVTSGMR